MPYPSFPKEYQGPAPIEKQVDWLAKRFSLSAVATHEFIVSTLPTLRLPAGAEGWFALPSVRALARRHFPRVTDPAEQYRRAVQFIIDVLSTTRPIDSEKFAERITPQNFRQHQRTTAALTRIEEMQKGDILVLPAQFGMRYGGKSVIESRKAFVKEEFGIGIFGVGCMAFTHTERFVRYEQLHCSAPGDECTFTAHREILGWEGSPTLSFLCDQLEFEAIPIDWAFHRGSVTGFVPSDC